MDGLNDEIQAVLAGDSDGCIVCGDCLDVMADMPDGCVDMCVTSPPYWGLRDYGVEGQIGLEETPERFVAKMVAVFAEVKRVLADHGTLWLNLGDSYNQGNKGNSGELSFSCKQATNKGSHATRRGRNLAPNRKGIPGLKPKDLIGIPWRVALALQADGWYLRSDIIWHKPNPMPESCQDRPTKAHEYLFLLSKRPKYFYDAEAVREGVTGNAHARGHGINPKAIQGAHGSKQNASFSGSVNEVVGARNKRTVWTISTQAMSAAHFSTYPEKLVTPCILAGTSAAGHCPACGRPWERVVARNTMVIDRSSRTHSKGRTRSSGTMISPPESTTIGWWPTCRCFGRWYVYRYRDPLDGDKWRSMRYWRSGKHPPLRPGLVLDPFGGTGTTGVVAAKNRRRYILIELNADYIRDIGQPRLNSVETGLPVAEAKGGQMGLFGPEDRT